MTIEFTPLQSQVEVPACMPAPAPVCKPATPAVSPVEAGPAFENGVDGSVGLTSGFAATGTFSADAPIGRRRPGGCEGAPLTPTGFVAELRDLRAKGVITSDGNLRAIVELVEAAYKQGSLNRTDSSGVTLLQRLHEIATTPTDPALQGKTTPGSPGHVLIAVLTNITAPTTTMGIQQRGSTCATKAMEYIMATRDPAGYAAMVGQLAAGKDAKGLDGSTVTLDRSALLTETSSRNLASRLFQASVNHSMITNWLGNHTYANSDADMVKGRGLDEGEAAKAAKAVLGPGWETHGSKPDVATLRLPALAAVRWHMDADEITNNDPSNGHAVIIEKVENGRVYFRDPGEGGQAGDTVQADGRTYGPKRLCEGNDLFSMPADDFGKLINYYSEPPAKP